MSRRGRWLIVWAGLALSAAAQRTPAPAGTVSGRVLCGDTQLPARFAEVSLVRKPSKAELDTIFGEKTTKKVARKAPETIDILQEHTGLDGSYTVEKVPPGDYWVVVKREGYIFPIASAQDEKQERDLDRLMARAVPVHVDAERIARADVTLERGGVVTGRVAFDDGSAAVLWDVWLAPVEAGNGHPAENPYTGVSEAEDDPRVGLSLTDDEGTFRMAGIAPGKYVLVTQLALESGRRVADASSMPESGGEQQLTVYAPGVFAWDAAGQIEIHGTETARDADLKLDLSRLRTIRGRVLGKAEGRPMRGAMVYADSGTYKQQGVVQEDGSFHLDFLPPGSYSISVVPGFPSLADRSRQYDRPPKQTVVVDDVDLTLDDILLSERKTGKGPE